MLRQESQFRFGQSREDWDVSERLAVIGFCVGHAAYCNGGRTAIRLSRPPSLKNTESLHQCALNDGRSDIMFGDVRAAGFLCHRVSVHGE